MGGREKVHKSMPSFGVRNVFHAANTMTYDEHIILELRCMYLYIHHTIQL